jgi:membrane-associated phospholipid phosphatase
MIRLMVTGICMTLIFTIPVSRIYLGAHWFTDVLGGFMLGLICLYILSYLYLKKKQMAAR